MTVLNTEQIDRDIASRVAEVTALSMTLIELDDHPGLAHVRRYPPSGTTAQPWATAERSLAQLWEDLGHATSILESAQAIRARRSEPTEADRSELTRLLCSSPLDRMRATYPAVAEFFDAIDEIDSLIARRLAPLQKRLDESGATYPTEISDLLRTSATDPLSLTSQLVEQSIAQIADGIERKAAELAELEAIKADWPEALATTAALIDTLRDATQSMAALREQVERTVVAGPLPIPEDTEPGLRATLAAMSGAPDPAALMSLRKRIDSALRLVRDVEPLAQGLLDRRRELKGRLTVYQAKAARLGLGEDPDLLASGRIAAGLLSRRPCDLRAATRAARDLQELIAEKQSRRS